MKHLTQSKLDSIVERATLKKWIHGAVFRVETADQSLSLKSAAGNLEHDASFYIASINKLFLSAVALRLAEHKKLNLNDKVAKYLQEDVMNGLLVIEGVDHSNEITVKNLISHTSGLPCYLIDTRPDGAKVMDELLQGHDQEWPLGKVLAQVRKMKPKFRPGQKGKASYSNTNFRLMGSVLETITGQPIDFILTDLFDELAMRHTYVFDQTKNYVPLYSKEKPLLLPRYFESSKFDVISTSADLMIFLRVFFNGYFFPVENFQQFQKWNAIFFPFKYGTGIQQFHIPRILSPFRPVPDMLGHCGSVGTAAFYVPEKSLFITGTINQAKNPSVLFKTMIQIINAL